MAYDPRGPAGRIFLRVAPLAARARPQRLRTVHRTIAPGFLGRWDRHALGFCRARRAELQRIDQLAHMSVYGLSRRCPRVRPTRIVPSNHGLPSLPWARRCHRPVRRSPGRKTLVTCIDGPSRRLSLEVGRDRTEIWGTRVSQGKPNESSPRSRTGDRADLRSRSILFRAGQSGQ